MGIPFEASRFYVGILVPITVIVPISISIYKFKTLPIVFRYLISYMVLSGISNLLSKYLSNHSINTMPLAHIYTVLEFGIICLFYKKLLENTRIHNYISNIFFLFLILCVVNALFFQDIHSYNTYTRPLETIIVIWFAITYLVQIIEDFDKQIKDKVELNYINSAFLLYFSGSFVLFTIFNIFVKNSNAVSFALLDVHATLLLLMYALFTVALWKLKK